MVHGASKVHLVRIQAIFRFIQAAFRVQSLYIEYVIKVGYECPTVSMIILDAFERRPESSQNAPGVSADSVEGRLEDLATSGAAPSQGLRPVRGRSLSGTAPSQRLWFSEWPLSRKRCASEGASSSQRLMH